VSESIELKGVGGLRPSGALEVGLPPRTPIAMDEPGQIMSLIERAIDKGTSPEALEKLVDLADRVMRRRAELDFHRDLVEFQARVPAIARTDIVDYATSGGKRVTFHYATFDTMRKAIDPIAQEFGFGLSFSSHMEGGFMVRTCTLLHRNGHSITSDAPIGTANSNPGMSEQQKFAAAETSASRRALASVLGLNIAEVDDASQESSEPVTDEQVATLQALAAECTKEVGRLFFAHFKIQRFAELTQSRYTEAVRMLESKRK
jgi:hypothetical protein